MRRPLLLLILLGLAAGGVVLVMLGSDPPHGNGDPASTGRQQDRQETDVAPMSSDDRTSIREQVLKPAGPVDRLPAPVTMTFELSERVNRHSISQVNYKLRGPKGLRREADNEKAPVAVAVQELGKYVVLFEKPGFFPKDVRFTVAENSRDRHVDVWMRRHLGRARVEVRDRTTRNLMSGFKVRVMHLGCEARRHHPMDWSHCRHALRRIPGPG